MHGIGITGYLFLGIAISTTHWCFQIAHLDTLFDRVIGEAPEHEGLLDNHFFLQLATCCFMWISAAAPFLVMLRRRESKSAPRNGLRGPILSKPAVVDGEFYYTQTEFFGFFEKYFKENLRNYEGEAEKALKQAREIATHNMCIDGRYFVRPLEALADKPISPQEQAELLISKGSDMAVKAVNEAVKNAGIAMTDIDCVVYTSHQPFPFPSLAMHVLNRCEMKKDCVQIPVTSLGCAGGGFALRTARDYCLAHPDKIVCILSVELCSLGFRPHKQGMSWFLNASLFGDCVAATIVRGADFAGEVGGDGKGLEIVHGNQRRVQDTTGVSFFTYDHMGYHFITTQDLCNVAKGNCPDFARDLTRHAFNKEPKDIALNVIHPGGARMIRDIGGALDLEGTASEAIAWKSMARLGNVASATVLDMIRMAWGNLSKDSEVIVIGMGPGFVLDGVAMKGSA